MEVSLTDALASCSRGAVEFVPDVMSALDAPPEKGIGGAVAYEIKATKASKGAPVIVKAFDNALAAGLAAGLAIAVGGGLGSGVTGNVLCRGGTARRKLWRACS